MIDYPNVSHDYFPFEALEGHATRGTAQGDAQKRKKQVDILTREQRDSLQFCLEDRTGITLDPTLEGSVGEGRLSTLFRARLIRALRGSQKRERFRRDGLLVGIDSGRYDPAACDLHFRKDRRREGREKPNIEALMSRLDAMSDGDIGFVTGVDPSTLGRSDIEVWGAVWKAVRSGGDSKDVPGGRRPYLVEYDGDRFIHLVSPDGSTVFGLSDLMAEGLSPTSFKRVPNGLKYYVVSKSVPGSEELLKVCRFLAFRVDDGRAHFFDCPRAIGNVLRYTNKIGDLIRDHKLGCKHPDCKCEQRLKDLRREKRETDRT